MAVAKRRSSEKKPSPAKVAVLLRFTPQMLERIDRAAERLGQNRSAFIVLATAEKLETMERDN